MGTLIQDFRYGTRMLLKSPGVTAVAVIALTLAIGANTAIFSVVNTVLMRPLPYKNSEGLVMVWETQQQREKIPVSPADFVDWAAQSDVLENATAFVPQFFNLTDVTEPERIQGTLVTANVFPLLGINPILGRSFFPDEDRPGGNSVLVLSEPLWRSRFGADRNIIGRAITLDGKSYTVIGVMPKEFQLPRSAGSGVLTLDQEGAVWIPLAAFDPKMMTIRTAHFLRVMARLKPGVTQQQAQASMSNTARGLQQQYPETNTDVGVNLVSVHEELVGRSRPALIMLLVAVGFVLLIACTNVANLLLARAATRQKEVAIRTALGASRVRLIRQLLTESLLLALIGGGLGLLLALAAINVIVAFSPSSIPRVKEIGLDGYVVAFTLIISVLTGIVFGLAPALQTARPDLTEALKEGGRDSTSGSRGNRVRSVLVVAEVALALLLLIGGGLMLRSFLHLQSVSPGFNAQNLLTMEITLPRSKYPERQQQSSFYQQVLSRIATSPGTQSVAAINDLPLRGYSSTGFIVEGLPAPLPGQEPTASYRVISPNYFQTMGVPILKGRDFTDRDLSDSPAVAVINEKLARRYWPDEDPVGKRIRVSSNPVFKTEPLSREIVGVVGDVRYLGLEAEPTSDIYVPYLQDTRPVMSLVIRTESDPMGLAAAARREVWGIDKDQPVSGVMSMEQRLYDSISQRRFSTLLLGVFAGVALVLAIVGIYGTISYSVAQRTHEIGIRMALGAQAGDVLKLVVGQGTLLALTGVGIGLVAAFILTRFLSTLLYAVSVTDPITFLAISLLLIGTSLFASYVPARRATKVDPLIALKNE